MPKKTVRATLQAASAATVLEGIIEFLIVWLFGGQLVQLFWPSWYWPFVLVAAICMLVLTAWKISHPVTITGTVRMRPIRKPVELDDEHPDFFEGAL